MRRSRDDDEKKSLVESFLRDKAEKAATDIVDEIKSKVARDVDARLRHFAPDPEPSRDEGANLLRCGRLEEDDAALSSGMTKLFQRYYKQGMSALNRGDAGAATFFLGKCLLLPVPEALKRKQMVRHNLRLAMSLRERLKGK